MKNFLDKHRSLVINIALVLFLLAGAYLRLYRISGYMTFLGDEGRDVLVVKRMIVDHKFTLLGPTASVGGFFLGPIYYYFMLPFLWAWQLDPTGPAVMVALFGIATIYLVYLTGKAFFNSWVGLIAASLYSLSPLVISYSRSSWNPNLVPFFSVLLIYLLGRISVEKKGKFAFAIGLCLGIGLQLHYLFLFLFVLVGIWFALSMRSLKYLRIYFYCLIGFGVGYAPFLIFELRHGFPNTISIIRFLGAGKETGFSWKVFWGNIADVTFRLFGRLVFRLPQAEIWYKFSPLQIWLWISLIKFSIFSSLGLIFLQTAGLLPILKPTQKKFKLIVLLTFWYLIVIILFGFYKRGIYDYYFGIFFALPFLLVALTLYQFNHWKWGWIPTLVIWVALLWLNWQGRPFLYPPNNQLAQARSIAKEAFAKAEGKPFNFALVANFNSDHAYRYFFEIWGNKPLTIENEANDPKRQTVANQLIVICEIPDCKPLGHPLWEIAGFGQAEIVGEWSTSFVKIFKLVHYKRTKT